jgi:hypothetical protein
MQRISPRRPLASYASPQEYAAANTARFWARVSRGEGCWEWQRGRSCGYGTITWRGTETKAHRVAWELTHGEIPAGLHVLHNCDNPGCVRPEHLRLGTHTDNMRDIVAHGYHPQARKTHCPKGHEYTPDNVYRYGARRHCKACHRRTTVDAE